MGYGDVLVYVLVEDFNVVLIGVVNSEDGFQGNDLLALPKDHFHGSSALPVLLEFIVLAV